MTDDKLNLMTPVEVPLEAVERELASLWSTAMTQQGAIVRACSCNVIAVATESREAEALRGILAKVSEQYPCRSIITYAENPEDRNERDAAPHMHAWIGGHCTLPVSSGPQICSEILTVTGYSEAIENLPDTVAALLVADLPVFIYWRSFRSAEQALVEQLVRFSNGLIVDSHVLKEDPRNRDRLFELLNQAPEGVIVRDLNWGRLTAWRDLIAQFFDPPSARHLVWDISEVEICRAVVPGSIPTRTLLLTGWLATRLRWKRVSAERNGDTWVSRWSAQGGEVVVRFVPDKEAHGEEPGIKTVTLRTRSGPSLVVTRHAAAGITASASSRQRTLVHTVEEDASDEASLLVEELSLSGEDLPFKESLAEALALEKSFAAGSK